MNDDTDDQRILISFNMRFILSYQNTKFSKTLLEEVWEAKLRTRFLKNYEWVSSDPIKLNSPMSVFGSISMWLIIIRCPLILAIIKLPMTFFVLLKANFSSAFLVKIQSMNGWNFLIHGTKKESSLDILSNFK